MTTSALARAFADLAVRNIDTEFPHATAHVVRGIDDPARPKALHPAFHGSFDWHSCVHMHWLLVRLLTEYADRIDRNLAVSTLDRTLTEPALRAEAWYLRENPRFERPYGWAWALALAAACADCPHPAATAWSAAMEPVATAVDDLAVGWLSRAAGPVRHGGHQNTAFALTLLIDAADALGRDRLAASCRERASEWFSRDRDYPAAWEPSGQDFLSPALCEAQLVRRVLSPQEFPRWLAAFLPGLAAGEPTTLCTPARVVDPADDQQGHLFGLNLTRAWQFCELAAALGEADHRFPALTSAGLRQLSAGLNAVSGLGFGQEHWLATFAYLAASAGEASSVTA